MKLLGTFISLTAVSMVRAAPNASKCESGGFTNAVSAGSTSNLTSVESWNYTSAGGEDVVGTAYCTSFPSSLAMLFLTSSNQVITNHPDGNNIVMSNIAHDGNVVRRLYCWVAQVDCLICCAELGWCHFYWRRWDAR